jgi:hypothetical protein
MARVRNRGQELHCGEALASQVNAVAGGKSSRPAGAESVHGKLGANTAFLNDYFTTGKQDQELFKKTFAHANMT